MKLFHYTSRDAALEHILPTGRLRFGRLPRTNDPREFAPVWFGIAGFIEDDEPLTARSPFALIEEVVYATAVAGACPGGGDGQAMPEAATGSASSLSS